MSRQGITSRMEHPPLHRGENSAPQETPVVSHVQPTSQPTPVPSHRPEPKKTNKFSKKNMIIAGAVAGLIAIVAIIGMLLPKGDGLGAIDSGRYQAVFFTNGQVYFGKLHPLSGGYMKLTNIFYLQTKSSSDSGNPQETDSESDQGVVLIKLGDEIHGPEDEMIISKDQVLFFENLKPDGKVSQTIKGYKPS